MPAAQSQWQQQHAHGVTSRPTLKIHQKRQQRLSLHTPTLTRRVAGPAGAAPGQRHAAPSKAAPPVAATISNRAAAVDAAQSSLQLQLRRFMLDSSVVRPAKVAGVALWGCAYVVIIAYHDLVGLSLVPTDAQAFNLAWEVVKVTAMCSSPLEAALFTVWPLLDLLVALRLWVSGDLGGMPLAAQHALFVAGASVGTGIGFAAAAHGRSSVPARLFRWGGLAAQWPMAAYMHEHMAELCSHGPLATSLVGVYVLLVGGANAAYTWAVVADFSDATPGTAGTGSTGTLMLLRSVTVFGQLGQVAVASEFMAVHAPGLLAAAFTTAIQGIVTTE